MARIFHPTPLLVLFFLLVQGRAVEPYVPVVGTGLEDQWRWRAYPEVADLGILCVEEASDGMVWAGGDRGVMSYDGWEWLAYGREDGLDGGSVNDLLATTDGRLYAGTERGLYEFDAANARWQNLAPEGCELTFHIHRMIESADGSLLMATVWGLLSYDGSVWALTSSADMLDAGVRFGERLVLNSVPEEALPLERWAASPGIKVIENDFVSTGKETYPLLIWAVAEGSSADRAGIRVGDEITAIGGTQPFQASYALTGLASTEVELAVRKRDTGELVELSLQRTDLPGGVRPFSITDVIEDRDGSLWVGEARQGSVIQFAGDRWVLHTAAVGDTTPGIVRLAETGDGRIWKVSQNGDSPLEVYSDGDVWRVINDAGDDPDLRDDNIQTSIIETADGLLWVGGHDGTLHLLQNDEWSLYEPPEIPTSKVRLVDMLESSRGDLWIVGSRSGLSRFLHSKERWLVLDDLVFAAVEESGRHWFLKDFEKVVTELGGDWLEFDQSDGLIDNVRGVLTSGDTVVAFGADASMPAIATFDREAFEEGQQMTWSIRRIPNFAGRVDENAVLHAADGTLWLGGSNVEEGQAGGFVQLRGPEAVYHPGAAAPLSPYALVEGADGELWSGGPLTRFADGSWRRDDHPDEVQSHIHDLLIGDDGSLWVATRFYGVMRRLDGEWSRYTMNDGLPDNRVEGLYADKSGIVWASTPQGLGRFDGRSWSHEPHDFDVVFDSLRGSVRGGLNDDVWFAWKDHSVRYRPDRSPPRTRIVDAREEYFDPGTITFEVAGRDARSETEPRQLAFSYRLNGGEWSPFRKGGLLQVPSVGHGSHELEVRSRDWDYNIDPNPAKASFAVVRPIWQRPWFIAGVLVVFGFLVLQTVRLIERDRRMLAVNEELRLRGAELEAANEELRSFSYAVSHDLRAPLRHLAGYSSILMEDFGEKLGGDGGRMIGRIRNATQRLEDIMEGLLVLCRSTNSELQHANVDVTLLAKEISAEAEREHWKGRGRFDIQEHMKVTGDPRLIRVVLQNLLGNATKFSARVDDPLVKVDLLRNGAEVVIRVADNGAGFNMEYAENLFQPFRRLHSYDDFAGTGIGLATVSRIVRRHGGRIWAEAEEGKGATFSVAFPERPA